MDDALLFLHVLAAFLAVAAVVVFTVMVLSVRGGSAAADSPALRLTPVARRLWDIGGAGTLVLGVWLALKFDQYGILDGWIIAAFVLWAIAGFAGAKLGQAFYAARDGGDGAATLTSQRTMLMYALMTVAVTLLLIDMIYKPGV